MWLVWPILSGTLAAQQAEPSATAPAAAVRGGLDQEESGLAEFAQHFSAHEPIYFLIGTAAPNVKFQVSFKYAIFNPDAPLVRAAPALAGVNIAYSQTSLWDISEESAPFFDSSYRPEILWSDEHIPSLSRPGLGFGFQGGFRHESNGRGGDESRSMNIAYLRPIVTLGDPTDFHVTVAPRFFTYLGHLGDNPDIKDYRGYGDLRVTAGWREGLEASVLARVGDDWDHASAQVDLTYPLRKILGHNFDIFLDIQGFYGYGESLIRYDERTATFRAGIAIVR